MLKAILLDLDNTMILYDEPQFYERYFKRVIPLFADLISPDQFPDRLLKATMSLREKDGNRPNRDFFIDRLCPGDAARGQEIWDRFMTFYENGYDAMGVPVAVPERLDAVLEHLVDLKIQLVLASNPISAISSQYNSIFSACASIFIFIFFSS